MVARRVFTDDFSTASAVYAERGMQTMFLSHYAKFTRLWTCTPKTKQPLCERIVKIEHKES